ncbi:MAG: transposase [Burkholderiales bacterium]|nr:transposase [Burkholderiales bacterium]
MDCLTFNSVLRIEAENLDGFYRVLAAAPGKQLIWLAFIGARDSGADADSPAVGSVLPVDRENLTELAEASLLAIVNLDDPALLAREDALSEAGRQTWEARQAAMRPFLDPQQLSDSLYGSGGIGPVVRKAVDGGALTRATIYRLWKQLCVRGLTMLSLMPVFDQCGAPGVRRPAENGRRKAGAKTAAERMGIDDPNPQRGATTEDRIKIAAHLARLMKPGANYAGLYEQIMESVYVTQYVVTEKGREPVLPPKGTFPNRRIFRNIYQTEFKDLDRVRRRTTPGHFARNKRGLVGNSHEGVAGPGHAYAIDSTVGDVYLRSAINRTWIVGRPIVYIIVDVWSTAIVGFYVCLRPPSWRAAKVALFSTFADPRLIAELWGYEYRMVLDPAPTAPFTFWCDRGEYLSEGARDTALRLSLNTAFNPAYRPDGKGSVEVVHRIAKDAQFSDFIPGAIDARRDELELRTDVKESALTLREYVQYLYMVFTHHNAHADREHRNTAELISSGWPATPAGLWRFGHEAGLGFRRHIPLDQLVAALLEPKTLVARRNGNFTESLQYEGELAIEEEWSAQARNFGVLERQAYCFPGHAGRLWVPDAKGLQDFRLKHNARTWPETTFDEWRDAMGVALARRSDREYQQFCDAIRNLDARNEIVKRAQAETAAAEALSTGSELTTTQARAVETSAFGTALLAQPSGSVESALPKILSTAETADYDATMDELLAGVVSKEAA